MKILLKSLVAAVITAGIYYIGTILSITQGFFSSATNNRWQIALVFFLMMLIPMYLLVYASLPKRQRGKGRKLEFIKQGDGTITNERYIPEQRRGYEIIDSGPDGNSYANGAGDVITTAFVAPGTNKGGYTIVTAIYICLILMCFCVFIFLVSYEMITRGINPFTRLANHFMQNVQLTFAQKQINLPLWDQCLRIVEGNCSLLGERLIRAMNVARISVRSLINR